MEWSVQEVARLAGTTSRTLRHYDAIGLLRPARVAANGYRYYDEDALVRLQRILLLRQLGIGLDQIGEILDRRVGEQEALSAHLAWLREERERLSRQIAAVTHTLQRRRERTPVMAEDMFDGFDHTEYREEVTRRWGEDAYARSDAWWRGMGEDEKAEWGRTAARLTQDWVDAAEAGADPAGEQARELAARHVRWLSSVPGTPAATPGGDVTGYVRGLAEMYPADPRFAATYATAAGGTAGAEFVRDALLAYVGKGA